MQTLTTQTLVMRGKGLALAPRARVAARTAPLNVNAVLGGLLSSTKAKTVKGKKSSDKTSSGPKTLIAGKDIKATQFTVGLSEKKGFKVALGFTAQNEILVSRAAMLGIAFSIIGELVTGKGALAQLGYETGLPIGDIDGAIIGVIIFNLVAALLPAKGRFVPDEADLEERPAGALQDPSISLANPAKFLGIQGFGFNRLNELFVGRLAQLGFAASLIGESLTGKGILAQFDYETGLPLSETEPLLLFSILFTLFAAIGGLRGSGRFVEEDE